MTERLARLIRRVAEGVPTKRISGLIPADITVSEAQAAAASALDQLQDGDLGLAYAAAAVSAEAYARLGRTLEEWE